MRTCFRSGDEIGMDIATVHNNGDFLSYNLSMLAYGYYGDVLSDSENYRWMGPKRYDFSGIPVTLRSQTQRFSFEIVPMLLLQA